MNWYVILIFPILILNSCNQESKFSTQKSKISQKIDISKIKSFCDAYIKERFGHLNPTTPAFDYNEDEIIIDLNGSLFIKKFYMNFSIIGKENICRATISGNLWLKGNNQIDFNQSDFSNYDCLGISKVSAKAGGWISVVFNIVDGAFVTVKSISKPENTVTPDCELTLNFVSEFSPDDAFSILEELCPQLFNGMSARYSSMAGIDWFYADYKTILEVENNHLAIRTSPFYFRSEFERLADLLGGLDYANFNTTCAHCKPKQMADFEYKLHLYLTGKYICPSNSRDLFKNKVVLICNKIRAKLNESKLGQTDEDWASNKAFENSLNELVEGEYGQFNISSKCQFSKNELDFIYLSAFECYSNKWDD